YLQVGDRSHERSGILVDLAEVVCEQHRDLDVAEHAGMVTGCGGKAGHEGLSPLRIVFLQVLRRSLRRVCGTDRGHRCKSLQHRRWKLTGHCLLQSLPVADRPLAAEPLVPQREQRAYSLANRLAARWVRFRCEQWCVLPDCRPDLAGLGEGRQPRCDRAARRKTTDDRRSLDDEIDEPDEVKASSRWSATGA